MFPMDESGSSPRMASGILLGHFRIEEEIGRGGMGAVFRAVDTRLQRVVALKVLAPSQASDQSSIDRFHNEAQAAVRLDHDNIARVYYVGEDQSVFFIAFEFVHGTNVRDLIRSRGTLSLAETINYGLQIAQALKHTDAAGVVHRDIKPSNIIITPAGRAKLVDLGLARKHDPDASKDLTVDGTTLGTFDYISPEQARSPRDVDVRSDIYSLGCTLYHMLTGEPPYPRGTMLQKLLDHQGKDTPDASTRNPRVPPELSAVVRRMMAADPEDRYGSPDELIHDLSIVAHGLGLRPVFTENQLWSLPVHRGLPTLWESYRGWILTLGLLLAVVFAIDRSQTASGPALSSGIPPAPENSSTGQDRPLTDTGTADHPTPSVPTQAPQTPVVELSPAITSGGVDNSGTRIADVPRVPSPSTLANDPSSTPSPLGAELDEGPDPVRAGIGSEPIATAAESSVPPIQTGSLSNLAPVTGGEASLLSDIGSLVRDSLSTLTVPPRTTNEAPGPPRADWTPSEWWHPWVIAPTTSRHLRPPVGQPPTMASSRFTMKDAFPNSSVRCGSRTSG